MHNWLDNWFPFRLDAGQDGQTTGVDVSQFAGVSVVTSGDDTHTCHSLPAHSDHGIVLQCPGLSSVVTTFQHCQHISTGHCFWNYAGKRNCHNLTLHIYMNHSACYRPYKILALVSLQLELVKLWTVMDISGVKCSLSSG